MNPIFLDSLICSRPLKDVLAYAADIACSVPVDTDDSFQPSHSSTPTEVTQ